MKLSLPSGLVGDVRKIKGTQIAALAEAASGNGPADGGFSGLLAACWEETLDAGPYAFVKVGDTKPDCTRILKGDLLAGVIYLRRMSLTDGDEFDFDAHCEECREKIPWSIKLSELPLRLLSKANADKVRNGESFVASAAGHVVRYNLQTLAQEEPIMTLMKQMQRTESTIVDTLCAQVTSVEGVKPDMKSRWRFLADLSMGELLDLQETMQAEDCGVNTAIEIRCQKRSCQWEQEIALPLFSRRFFSPKRRPKKTDPEPASGETFLEESASNGGENAAPTSGGTSTVEAVTVG